MAPAPETLFEARGIAHGYRAREVLRGAGVALARGEVVALLGPNGAGKTTLLKVVTGAIAPREGTVDRSTSGRAGWVPQGDATYQRLTVRENLRLFVRLGRIAPRRTAGALAVDAARQAGLEPWLDAPAAELSGGLRQRLSVAVGLLGDPELLVLDEPTTGVDVVHREALFELLRERARGEARCGALFSTHSLEDAAHADRVLVLVGGRIVHDGALADVAGRLGELWTGAEVAS